MSLTCQLLEHNVARELLGDGHERRERRDPLPHYRRTLRTPALRSRHFAALASALATLLAACEGDPPTAPGAGRDPAGAPPVLATPSLAVTAAVPSVVVYIHAHQDDWQLFMGDQANASIQSGAKVVFVYTTAGDAGNGAAYWQAREAGARASVNEITPAGSWTCGTQTVRTHPIRRCVKGSAISYDMRMPSGNPTDGTGHGFGSLKLLRDQGTDTRAIDGSTTYTTWSDFAATIGGIVDLEAGGQSAPSLVVHAPEHDRVVSPNDHPDHWATADAVRAAAATRVWDVAWHIDYHTKNLAVNVSTEDHAIKQDEFLAYDSVMVARGYSSLANNTTYQAWLWRTYFRTERTGPTNTPPVANAGGPYTGSEGTAVPFSSAGSSDPNGQALTYSWRFGDGTTSTAANPSKTYADNGTYAVRLIVTDASGAADTATTSATIGNIAPTASLTLPSAVEGTAYTLSLSGATDAGSADRSSLQYSFDCGQGAGFTAWGTTASTSCPAVPDQRTLTVQGRVRDKDGAVRSYTKSLAVANAAPAVAFSATTATSVAPGATVSFSGSFTDKGANDATWSYTIVWGDGTASKTGTRTAQGALPAASHVYSTSGTWKATLKVTDKDGASTTSAAITVTVGYTRPSNLNATGFRQQGDEYARLTWTKGSAPTVDVWRGSTKVRSAISNTGSYTDRIGKHGKGTYTYRVCIAGRTGTTNCSNSDSVSF